MPHGIACAHSSDHGGSNLARRPVNNSPAITRRVGGAGHQCRGWSANVVPDEPLRVSTDPHQHHHRTYLCYRWGSWVVNHFGVLSATDSFLRFGVTGFTQGLEKHLVNDAGSRSHAGGGAGAGLRQVLVRV